MPLIPILDAITGDKLSWAAFACNVGLHFTQTPLMMQMLRDGDSISLAKYSAYPACLQVAACSMWLIYGLIVFRSTPLIANNTIGVFVGLCYCACFILKRPTVLGKMIVLVSALFGISVALTLYGTLYFGPTSSSSPLSRDAKDAVASAFTIAVTSLFWASPLAALRAAAADLDDKRVPVPLTLIMKCTVTLWLVALS